MPEPLIQQNQVIPNTGGTTVGINNIGTGGAQVIGIDQSRKSITFHNPNISGNVNLLIYQTLNSPTFASPGGGYVLFPGATITFTGDCQSAWGAVAASGSTNGLTITPSRT